MKGANGGKQKEWRRHAAAAKQQFVREGLHQIGMRYGRFIRNARLTQIKAVPSTLFQVLCINAGHIRGS